MAARPSPRSAFGRRLEALRVSEAGRRWVYVPYDQLTDRVGPLSRIRPAEAGIVLVESREKAARRPYHRQKLALVLASQRHFALEQARRGVAVRYVAGDAPYAEALAREAKALGPLLVMRPAERELRTELAPLMGDGTLEEVPHEGWLTSRELFETLGGPPWRMDAFYRRARKETGWLVEDGRPVGGTWSLDAENRLPWPGEPAAPRPPRFRPDAVTKEVCAFVTERFPDHPGSVDPTTLPASRAQVDRAWTWAKTSCLEHFGAFEDAMSERSRGLFHTRIAPLLNLHRLLPEDVVCDVATSDAPLNSREGFVRQVLGWREFVHHVHEATDGLRTVPAEIRAEAPQMERPLPPAFWGTRSGLRCLDTVVEDVWDEGWSHHITRLMVLSNIATLLDVSPRELTDWFWVAYVDAFDWVVEPNVMGMGTFGLGGLMTTKPYVSGAAYIDRMSDYCDACAFDPKRTCPITSLYWAWLARHEKALEALPRMRLPMTSLARRDAARRREDRQTYERVSEMLGAGTALDGEEDR